jgi:hypothetical protein
VSTTALLADGSIIGAAVAIAGIATAGTEFDPVRLAPQLDAVQQDSDRAHVYDYRITPGANDPMPSRPHGLGHVIGGGKMRGSSPAGGVGGGPGHQGPALAREPEPFTRVHRHLGRAHWSVELLR